jgi:glycosyltransferase involved in cell wall biosynthesis
VVGVSVRILHVVGDLALRAGGPARCVLQLAGTLRNQGFEVLVAGSHAEGPDTVLLRHVPLPWQIPTRSSAKTLAKAIQDAAIVQIHGLWNGTVSLAAMQCRHLGVPYILTPHGMLDPVCLAHHARRKRIYRRFIERRTLAGAAGFHFLSEEERDRAVRPVETASVRSAVAPNSAPAIPDLDAGVLAALFPQTVGRHVALYLGRLDEIKGIDLQLRALALIPEKERPLLLVVGPDFGDEPRLRALARSEGVDDWVVWAGPVYGTERLALLAEADAVLMTSLYDCNPIVLPETLAVGGVLLATDSCGGSAAAARKDAAVVVQRRPDELAATLRTLLADRERRRRLRQAARAYAASDLEPIALIRPLVTLYSDVAERRVDSTAAPGRHREHLA